MRVRIFIAALATLVSISYAAAAGPLNKFTVGKWEAGSFRDQQTGRFTACMASVRYKSGIRFFVAVSPQMKWSIAFFNPDWKLRVGEVIRVSAFFDGRPYELSANAIDPTYAMISMPDDSALSIAFRRAYVLRALAQGSEFQFNLDGTSRLLPALINCVKAEINRDANPQDGANNKRQNPSPGPRSAPPSFQMD